MNSDWALPMVIIVMMGVGAVVAVAKVQAKECPADRDLERACLLAEGSAMRHAGWLEPGHLRREEGLVLLSADAAWAPVCAKDAKAGERLRDQIADDLGTPDAPHAAALARELVTLLQDAP